MKGFIGLAILLLAPTVAYFQKQHFENSLQPKLEAEVLEVLVAEGVEEPAVRMNYFDATLAGRVETEDLRQAVASKVEALPGVRLRKGGNRIVTLGWLRLNRVDGRLAVEGLVPNDFVIKLPREMEQAGWDDLVTRRDTVAAPFGALDWAEFLQDYFNEPGDRSVELRERGLLMEGDATVVLRFDWVAKASGVVGKENVSEQFTLQPSLYHFPGYRPTSIRKSEILEQVRQDLSAALVVFENGSSEVPEGEREKVVLAADAMVAVGPAGRYVVGGHPPRGGNATGNAQLARARAEAVVKLLQENGVEAGQLQVVSFGAVGGEERAHQVEILVR